MEGVAVLLGVDALMDMARVDECFGEFPGERGGGAVGGVQRGVEECRQTQVVSRSRSFGARILERCLAYRRRAGSLFPSRQ